MRIHKKPAFVTEEHQLQPVYRVQVLLVKQKYGHYADVMVNQSTEERKHLNEDTQDTGSKAGHALLAVVVLF